MSGTSALHARITARVGRVVLDTEIDAASGTLVIVGPNGAGKTSLLLCLLGVMPGVQGRVVVGDRVLLDSDVGVAVALEERRLGYVPQDYALFPHMTVRRNVEFALASTRSTASWTERRRRVDALLEDLDLTALAQRRPQSLSGGEKQRVALARALSVEPFALLLDEPLAALDVHARRGVRSFLAAYLGELALPTLIVTHDAHDARALGHRIAVMESGRITQVGTWSDLAARPATRFIEEFVESSDESRCADASGEGGPNRKPGAAGVAP